MLGRSTPFVDLRPVTDDIKGPGKRPPPPLILSQHFISQVLPSSFVPVSRLHVKTRSAGRATSVFCGVGAPEPCLSPSDLDGLNRGGGFFPTRCEPQHNSKVS